MGWVKTKDYCNINKPQHRTGRKTEGPNCMVNTEFSWKMFSVITKWNASRLKEITTYLSATSTHHHQKCTQTNSGTKKVVRYLFWRAAWFVFYF